MNRLNTCITLILFLTLTSLFAQDKSQLDYIVLHSGDTLHGNVNYIDERGANRKFYKKIRLTIVDGRRKKYKRKDISAFSVDNEHYKSFWLSQSAQELTFVNPKYDIDPKDGEQHFLKVISKGKLSHFELQWFGQGNTTLWSMTLLKKEDNSFFIRANQGIIGLKRKVLSNYFFNCPKLKEAINQKQLNKVSQVVDFYNSHCVN